MQRADLIALDAAVKARLDALHASDPAAWWREMRERARWRRELLGPVPQRQALMRKLEGITEDTLRWAQPRPGAQRS